MNLGLESKGLFPPDRLIQALICGSIIDKWSSFQSYLVERLETHRGFSETKNIQASTIGDLSGAIGATMLAQYKIGKGARP
jgi:hypothetical protein